MGNPQLEDGYTKIANEFLDILCKTHLGDYERRVLMAILRKTWGFNKKSDFLSISQICELTNIHKSHVSRTIRILMMRLIVTKGGNRLSINKNYNSWLELPKGVTTHHQEKLPKGVLPVTKGGNKKLPKGAGTKESKETNTKENVNVTNGDEINKANYYAELIAEKLNDKKSIGFYRKMCKEHNTAMLLQKVHEIIQDSSVSNPGAVFTSWILKRTKNDKLYILKTDITKLVESKSL